MKPKKIFMKKLLFIPALFISQILLGQKGELIKYLDAYKTADLYQSKEIIYKYSFIHDKKYEYDLNILYYSHIEGITFKTDIPNINGYKAIMNCKLKNGPGDYIDKKLLVVMYYDSVAKHYSVFNMREIADTKKEYQVIKKITDTSHTDKEANYSWLTWWAIMAGKLKEASNYNNLSISLSKQRGNSLSHFKSIETCLKRIMASNWTKSDEDEAFVEKESKLKLENIEGIGKFKIGKTPVTYLETFIKENNFERQSINSWDEYQNFKYQTYKIAEVFTDKDEPYMSATYCASYCKKVRAFYIPKMTIAEININNAFLTFYNDTLVRISISYSPEILNAFEVKYGKPRISADSKNVTCTSKITAETKILQETDFSSYWENRNIQCVASINNSYNDDCEKTQDSYILIYLRTVRSKIQECNDKEENKINEIKKANKKTKLNDL